MADIYLRSSDGSDSDNGSTWALAKATAAAALTAAGAGGTVYGSDNHSSDAGASIALASPGTAASPTRLISVDDSGNPEPPTSQLAGATVSTGAGSFTLTFTGFGYCRGFTFIRPGSGASPLVFGDLNPWFWRFVNCTFQYTTTASSGAINLGIGSGSIDDQRLEWKSCSIIFGHASQKLTVRCPFIWSGGSAAASGAVPTSLFLSGGVPADVVLDGVDLSAFTSGTALVDVSGASSGRFVFRNCKLGASVAITTGSIPGQGGLTVLLVNCDSADTNYRYYKQTYQGVIQHETIIVRTGGASDGTTTISRQMVSSANSKIYSPLVLDDIVKWNDTVGSALTAAVEIITDNVTLTDAECWIEVEYLGTSGVPLSSLANDRMTDPVFGTPANQTSSSETWTTTGLTTPVKQVLSASFTPQEKGPVRVRVMLAKPSTTVYVDPLVTISP